MGAVAVGAGTVKRGLVGTASGRSRSVEADITLSASYATGGDSLLPQSVGLRAITAVSVPSRDHNTRKPVATTSSGAGLSLQLAGTETAPLIQAFDAQGTEVANATNLSSRGPIRVRIAGY